MRGRSPGGGTGPAGDTGAGGAAGAGGAVGSGGVGVPDASEAQPEGNAGAGGAARTDAATSTGGTAISGSTTSGGAMGSGGAVGSSTGVTCPRLPGLDPLICDFENMTFDQTFGSWKFQGGDGLTGSFMQGAPPIMGTSKVEPTQEEAHSGTTALAYTITGYGTASLPKWQLDTQHERSYRDDCSYQLSLYRRLCLHWG